MKPIDLYRLSWTNIKGNKLRTFLTVAGVGVGIGAILFLVTLGFGLQKLTIDQITQSSTLTSLDVNTGSSSILKIDDEAIAKIKKIDAVEFVSPVIPLPGQVTFKNTTTDSVIKGIDKKFIDLGGLDINPDKLFPGNESTGNIPGVILSTGVLKLFEVKDTDKVIGQEFSFNIFIPQEKDSTKDMRKEVKKFILVGVIKDDVPLAYVDISVLKSLSITTYSSLKVKVDKLEDVGVVKEKIIQLGYNVSTIVDLISQIKSIFRVVEGVLAGFGVVALLVASIGMFNTMTIALLERTRDIGIMKAIGARKKDIKWLFVTEAVMIGFAGGLFGVLGGWLLGQGINLAVNMLAKSAGGLSTSLFYTPWQFVVGIIIFAAVVGVITGIYPARRAAKINPLDALRYE